MPEPLELATLRSVHAAEVQAFAREIDAFLDAAIQILDDACMLDAVSARVTLQAMRHAVLEQFGQSLRQEPRADPGGLLRALLCEAHAFLTDPDYRGDFEQWKQQAEPFVRS